MAMRTASPWWLSLTLGIGLFWIFIGERLLYTMPSIRVALTGLGIVLVFGVTAARAWTTSSTKGPRRQIERALLLCHVGTVASLLTYMLTTSWGPDSLHTPHASGALRSRRASPPVPTARCIATYLARSSANVERRPTFGVSSLRAAAALGTSTRR